MKSQRYGKVSVELSAGAWVVLADGKKLYSSSVKIDAINYARSIAIADRIVIHGREGQTFHSAPGKGKLSEAQIEAIVDGMTRAAQNEAQRINHRP